MWLTIIYVLEEKKIDEWLHYITRLFFFFFLDLKLRRIQTRNAKFYNGWKLKKKLSTILMLKKHPYPEYKEKGKKGIKTSKLSFTSVH